MGRVAELGSLGEVFMIIAQIANQTTQTVTQTGIGLGSAIAVVCSWHRNRSILWAILAGILSWFYVIYFAMTRRADETKWATKPTPNNPAGGNAGFARRFALVHHWPGVPQPGCSAWVSPFLKSGSSSSLSWASWLCSQFSFSPRLFEPGALPRQLLASTICSR